MNLYRCEVCQDVWCHLWPLEQCPSCGARGPQTLITDPDEAPAVNV